LEFELHNRTWFEQFVLPRSDSVYSLRGIPLHIDTCLEDYTNGTMHPCVILDQNGRIAGRANLKDIASDAGTTEIGYRIGQQNIGKGLATSAVRHLKELAYDHWRLSRIVAFVTTENPASARVLEKSGLVKGPLRPTRSVLKAKVLDCYQYEHTRDGSGSDSSLRR
jgi:ribosomal-protein-alanine N-acetyltransferase